MRLSFVAPALAGCLLAGCGGTEVGDSGDFARGKADETTPLPVEFRDIAGEVYQYANYEHVELTATESGVGEAILRLEISAAESGEGLDPRVWVSVFFETTQPFDDYEVTLWRGKREYPPFVPPHAMRSVDGRVHGPMWKVIVDEPSNEGIWSFGVYDHRRSDRERAVEGVVLGAFLWFLQTPGE